MAPGTTAAGAAEPVIMARNLGIEFVRNRKRRLQLREMLFHGTVTTPQGTFWALEDVSFDVMPGEAVGLIGANGCGKSTLLRLIAGVLLPDTGSVTVTEGVAPLIELTGGFLGDLTARDNIQLISGLHGMSRAEVARRFDEIVDFAGPQVRDALDTPFRHFSSGMQVRLGFSVVTRLDEPIILVDEVLAVGDRTFREKCYRRMEDLVGGGRTMMFVSHSERDLKRFCSRGIYLHRGVVRADGDIDAVFKEYVKDTDKGLDA